jgi:hypothetical protein
VGSEVGQRSLALAVDALLERATAYPPARLRERAADIAVDALIVAIVAARPMALHRSRRTKTGVVPVEHVERIDGGVRVASASAVHVGRSVGQRVDHDGREALRGAARRGREAANDGRAEDEDGAPTPGVATERHHGSDAGLA